MVSKKHPGKDGNEYRIGHIENIGLGNCCVVDGPVKAINSNAVGDCPADQQVVITGRGRLFVPEHNAAYNQKSEQKSCKDKVGRWNGCVNLGPTNDYG